MTLDLEGWARLWNCTPDEAAAVIREIETLKIATVTHSNADVTLMSRRLDKVVKRRKQAAKRQKRFRVTHRNAPRNGIEAEAEAEAEAEEYINSARSDAKTPRSKPSKAPEPEDVPEDLKDLKLYRKDAKLCSRWFELLPDWRLAYPGVDILAEVRKAHAWEVSNPKRVKKDRPKFLSSWLTRAQDRGGKGGESKPSWEGLTSR